MPKREDNGNIRIIIYNLWEVIDPKSERPADDKKAAQASWDKKDRSVFAS